MPNNQQLKLIHIAAREAGLITKKGDSRYRLLLKQYRDSHGRSVTSSKKLTNAQIDDLLGLCESLGWRAPGKGKNHYQDKVVNQYNIATLAQQQKIIYMAEELGWGVAHRNNFIKKMTGRRTDTVTEITPKEAYNIIEGIKAIQKGAMDGKKEAG